MPVKKSTKKKEVETFGSNLNNQEDAVSAQNVADDGQTKAHLEEDEVEPPSEDKKKAERAAKSKERRAERRVCQTILFKFTGTELYTELENDVQRAIKVFALPERAERTGSRVQVRETIDSLFPSVGTEVSGLDIFKATEWGRSDVNARVREMNKRLPENERYNMSYNTETKMWKLDSIGTVSED